ncbi:hypothetical protein [Brucella gallinifaecis]|uniref:hypothetical protein n=1 Tax=Brucella gallinifaecis TaxID=215590 RepID=UPI00235F3D03|nr:hypothetical protein [Brucella gallinifaecis]
MTERENDVSTPQELACAETGDEKASGNQPKKFISSETVGAPGGGGRTGCMIYLASIVVLLISSALGPLIYLGCAIFLGANVLMVILSFKGIPNFYRQGDCPHCDTSVKIIANPPGAITCPGCKHRLLLKDNRIYDVTV